MFCPQCGTAHTPGGRFCGNCGLRLPFATLAGATPDGGGISGRGPARAPDTGPARPTFAPTFTLAVVGCAVAFGLAFVVASTALRGLFGEARRDVAAQGRAQEAPRGAMGSLLSRPRQQRDDPGKVR